MQGLVRAVVFRVAGVCLGRLASESMRVFLRGRWGSSKRAWLSAWAHFLVGAALLAAPISALSQEAGAVPASIGGIEPPRAARSVHLGWSAPDSALFYLELTVERSTAGSYYMACGWNTGYFGIQELTG